MTCKTSSSSTSAQSGTAKKELTHCGAQISETLSGHWKIVQGNYFKWQKPITIPKDGRNKEPVTENECTALPGLLGALAWPATQMAPHHQTFTSSLTGIRHNQCKDKNLGGNKINY